MAKQTLPTGWKSVKLESIASKCTAKNRDFAYSLVLTNSAQNGIIPQTEHFDKEIAVEDNINGYFIVNSGDFVYNPRISTTAPCGPIRRNHLGETGVMSPLYTVIKLNNGMVNDAYVEYYFFSSAWYRYMKSIANYGARHDRMAITDDDFFTMPLPLPPLTEQFAIVEILSTANKLIAVKERLIAAKHKQKRWLMSQLLTGKLRLPGFSGAWESVQLRDYLVEISKLSNDIVKYPLYSSSRKGLLPQAEYYMQKEAMETNLGYKCVKDSQVKYRHMSDDEIFHFNINSTGGTILLSAEYPIFDMQNADKHFIVEYLNSQRDFRFFCKAQKKGGTRTRLYYNVLQAFKFRLPPLPEQQAIAAVLIAADREIELLMRELEQQRQIKKHLMQQLLTGRIRTKGATI